MNKPANLIGLYILLATNVVVWAFAWPISKVGLVFMDPIWYTVYRLVIGTVACFAILAVQGKLSLPKRQDIPLILSIGVLQMSLFLMLVNYGLSFVGAGRSAILVYSTPLWVTPLAMLFFSEKVNLLKWMSVLLGLCGIFLLFSPWQFDWHDPNVVTGNFMLLLAAVVWAIGILHSRYGTWHSSAITLVPWQLLLACLITVPAALALEPTAEIQWNATLIYTLLFNGLLATAYGYWAGLTVQKSLPVVSTSMYYLAVPVGGLLLSALLLSEPLQTTTLLAVGCIIAGLACVGLSGERPPAKNN